MKYSIFFLSLLLVACGSKQNDEQENESGVETVLPSKIAEVKVVELQPSNFHHETVSNGKATAHEYADLSFAGNTAVIDKVFVKNGDFVKKGQPIASLDRFKLENTLSQNRNDLDKAKLEMADVLIGQGYDPDKQSEIPAEVIRLARLRSGLDQAETQLAATERELSESTLTAPFDGIIANLFQKRHNRPDASEPFCRVISNGTMDVDFTVLESELAMIKPGDAVEVTSYASDESRTGRVIEINPLVDEDGLVKVKASVDGGKVLFDGMNVKVSVRRALDEQLVVPKSAVVLRTGKQVVFTVDGNKAMWNYVQTGLENMNEIVITEGLEPGMKVIFSGNVNLAHEAPIKVVSE